MKHPIAQSSLVAAGLSIAGKFAYFLIFAPSEEYDQYTRFFYLLSFVLALFIGLRAWIVQNPSSSFPDQVKSGMKIASVYAIVISSFTWVYYKFIDLTYFTSKIEAALSGARSTSKPEDLEQIKNTAEFIFNPFTHSTITLFGIMAIGFFYCLTIVLIFRWKPEIFGLSIKQ